MAGFRRYLLCVSLLLSLAGWAFAGGESLSWDFRLTHEDRVFRDFPLAPAAKTPTAFRLSCIYDGDPRSLRAVTVHLKSGDGWWFCQLQPGELGREMRLPFAGFTKEGAAGDIGAADVLRFSVWRGDKPGKGSLSLMAFGFDSASPIMVVAKGEAAESQVLRGAMSVRIERLLKKGGIRYDVANEPVSTLDLSKVRVVILPYALDLTERESKSLEAFVARGGKVVVYYCSDGRLGRALGIRPGRWESGAWSAITPSLGGGAKACPYPHVTENLLVPNPTARAESVGMWLDSRGEPSGRNAVVLSADGAWFAHVPSLATPGAVRHLAAVLHRLDPEDCKVRQPAADAVAVSSVGQWSVRAAWLSAVEPAIQGGWGAAFAKMRALGLNVLFARWAAGPSVLYSPAKMEEALALAPSQKIDIHLWVTCLSGYGVKGADRAMLKRLPGKDDWFDPRDYKTRKALADSIVAVAKRGVKGVHLDYVRMPEGVERSAELAEAVSLFVRNLSSRLRRECPGTILSAAVYPSPSVAAARCQDWPEWVAKGWVDFVTPMIYTESPAEFESSLLACRETAPDFALVPGIGVGADEAQVDGRIVEKELRSVLGCRGVSFYAFDAALFSLLTAGGE